MRILIALPLLTLVACAETAPPLPPVCGAEYGAIVGRNIGELDLPPGLAHRVIQPGARIEGAQNPARLNIQVDDKGWITGASCG